MDVEPLNGILSPNIHPSLAVASHDPIACFKPVFLDSPIDRFSYCVPEASKPKAYGVAAGAKASVRAVPSRELGRCLLAENSNQQINPHRAVEYGTDM